MTTECNETPNPDHRSGSMNGADGHVDCERLRALIPAYSIGTTDAEETAFVEAALPACPDAAAELTDYLLLAEEMLYIVSSPSPARSNPDVPMPYLEPVHARPKPRGQPARAAAPLPSRSQPTTGLMLAAAVVVVVFGILNVYSVFQLQALQQSQRELAAQFEAARTALFPASGGTALHRDLEPNEATDVNREAHAVLIWDSDRNVGSLYVTGLPELTLDQTYQLWLVRDDHSLSLGTFEVDAQGVGLLVFESPESVVSFQHVGVSTEPQAGSPAPTTPHLVIGEI